MPGLTTFWNLSWSFDPRRSQLISIIDEALQGLLLLYQYIAATCKFRSKQENQHVGFGQERNALRYVTVHLAEPIRGGLTLCSASRKIGTQGFENHLGNHVIRFARVAKMGITRRASD